MSDNFSLQYLTMDRVIQAILKLGQGCVMAKTDREAAFCQYPVHPDDWDKLGAIGDAMDGKILFR